MKNVKRCLVATLLANILFVALLKAQTLNKALLFISDMPIKIDGGCSFYVNKNISLNDGKFQFIIDANKRAFIEFAKGKYIFFKLKNRVEDKNSYTEYYTIDRKTNIAPNMKSGSVILKIDTITRFTDHQTLRSGLLFITYPGLTQKLKIWGKVDVRDKYYYNVYPKIDR